VPENSPVLEISALRQAWLATVRSADIGRLASLVAEDVVVVHGDGRCIRGKDEFEADFLKAFESFRIDQRVVDPEITIRGDWGSKSRGWKAPTPLLVAASRSVRSLRRWSLSAGSRMGRGSGREL